jgi:hypothetical protein
MNAEKTTTAPVSKTQLPPRRPMDMEPKKKYCGTCPICKALRATSAKASVGETADALARTGTAFMAHRECAQGFLEQGRGHTFTRSVFSELTKNKSAGGK